MTDLLHRLLHDRLLRRRDGHQSGIGESGVQDRVHRGREMSVQKPPGQDLPGRAQAVAAHLPTRVLLSSQPSGADRLFAADAERLVTHNELDALKSLHPRRIAVGR